jgi:PAS domain S-box-containing protein
MGNEAPFGIPEFPGYILAETLREDRDLVLFRGLRDADRSSVLLESPVHADAAPRVRARMEREHSLRSQLDPDWALIPVGLEHVRGRPSLVFEDPGGDVLSRSLSQPRTPGESLRIAIGLASALGKLHARGFIHKDIKPANILVDASGTVRLMGFGLASRMPCERQDPGPPEVISGTLAYMSPEQTGRMNRSIDSRSDLYGMGVTLYELFTGVLPFNANDPLEWVHCHIARQPVPPHERNGKAPAQVSAIVMKLMAKTAEDRYQTAAGAEADLRRCLEAWESRKSIEPFALGARDIPIRLLIPEKLYGREEESRRLLEAFARVEAGGRMERVLVSGYSGIGKSSLVQELHRAIVRPRGLFASGKFDKQRMEEPYFLFSQAFQSLTERILAGSPEELAAWRQSIQEAVGADGRVLTDLIPGLAFILGPQPEIPALSLSEARNRLHGVFMRFLGAFARPEHPLVLFLDDLQWQDGGGLALFEHLATHPDQKHLLLVGAYREAEVGPSHPLARALEAVRIADGGLTELRLAPLAREDVQRLLVDALHCTREEAGPLARCIHEKTDGNPFFTLHFLHFLHDELLIVFDPDRSAWTWDLERIQAQGISDNVADLMVEKLGRLPADALETLQRIACLGNAAETICLARILERTETEVHASLWPAVLAGMVTLNGNRYRILHDRIQEAAYSLIPETKLAGIHLAIGRCLLADRSAEAAGEDVFLLVEQFNRGLEGITEAAEREVVSRLNAKAGRKGMVSAAFGSAGVYLSRARALLPAKAWEAEYPETLALWMDGAESDFMAGQEDRAEGLLGEILARARSGIDRARVFLLRTRLYQAKGRYQEAVVAGLEGLRILGVAFPAADGKEFMPALAEASAEVKALAARQRVSDLAEASPASGEDMPVLLALAAEAMGPAYFSKSPYFPLFVLAGVRATLERGPVAESAFIYSSYAFLRAASGEAEPALEFAAMALRLNERSGSARARGTLLFALGAIGTWRRSFTEGAATLAEAVAASERVGDVNTAGNAAITEIWARMDAGETLESLAGASEKYLTFARRSRLKPIEHLWRRILHFLESFSAPVDGIRSLRRGVSGDPSAGRDEETEILAAFEKGGFSIGTAMVHIMNEIAALVFGRYEEALSHGRLAEGHLSPWLITGHERNQPFYRALAAAALHDDAQPGRKKELAAIVAHNLEPLRRMAEFGPGNYADRLELVQAEAARMEGRDLDAMRLYDRAILSAREHGFIHHEGLANEVAARFYLARGFETIAYAYLRNARAAYVRWGAAGKARQMDRLYPGLEESGVGGNASIGASLKDLDLLAVIKASQAVSGEIVLERFVERLLAVMLESAGAERGALIRPKDGGFVVEAVAEARPEGIEVRMAEESLSPELFPEAMLRFAGRTRKRLLVGDAAAPNPYAEDPYILARRPRSVLVLPLLKQSSVLALLYLENRLAPQSFTPGQADVAEMLASQAAVSLENARLYQSLQKAEERFSKAFRNSPSPMAIARSRDEVFLDANDRFLAIYGYAREEFLGHSIRGLGLIDAEEAGRANALAAAQGGSLREAEISIRNKAGKTLSLLASQEPIDLDGEACALVTHVDITGRKQLEIQFMQSQKMEAIGRLAGGVAHDFNNLLTAISGFGTMALESMEPSLKQSRYVREIIKASERAAALTRQLLTHSRMQVQQTLSWNLNGIVEDMVPMLKRLIGENIRLDMEPEPGLGQAMLDRGQVEQILLNLVVNARDAMSDSGRIVIKTGNVFLDQAYLDNHLESSPGPHVMLSVSDNGGGMTPEVKAKLFEPFFTTKPPGKGTGLGLSVVYGIVKQSKGSISVYSEPGMGTVFRIYFPENAAPMEASRAPETVRDLASLRGDETILLVEDAQQVRNFAALALEAQGYTVVEARNGVEALTVLETHPDIRLVVTDVVMPDMGGATLAGRIRQLRPLLPILFMSGFAEHTEVNDLIASSGERFLQKPFTPFDLARKVREVLASVR